MNEALQQLIDFIKNASPVIWESTLKQVYIEAGMHLLWSVVFGISSYVCYRLYLYGVVESQRDRYSDWDGGKWAAVICGVFIGLLAILLLTGVIGRLVNPEFYAIRYLIDSIN